MRSSINFVGVERADAFSSGFSLYLAKKEGGQTHVIEVVNVKTLEPGEAVHPTAHLDIEGAQRLMDQLYNYGLRPSDGAGSAGAMAAVQAHLKDLQRLVFKGKP